MKNNKIVTLQEVVDKALEKKLKLDEVSFKEIEVCADCKTILLPNEEAYNNYNNTEVLCHTCSVYCAVCEGYCKESEALHIDGFDICPLCANKE